MRCPPSVTKGLAVPTHAQRGTASERGQLPLRRFPTELYDLDRHRNQRPQPLAHLRFIRHYHHPLARSRHDLFAQQRPAVSLDQIECPTLDFVRAIDGQVDLGV